MTKIDIPGLGGHSGYYFLYDEITNFIDIVENNMKIPKNIYFCGDLVPAGYYETDNCIYGYIGLHDTSNPKTAYSKNIETLCIKFETTEEWFLRNKDKLESLIVTPGVRTVLNIYNKCIKYDCDKSAKKYGLYKKEGFDRRRQLRRPGAPACRHGAAGGSSGSGTAS